MAKSYQQALQEAVLRVIHEAGALGILSTSIRRRLPARGRGISASEFQTALRHLRARELVCTEGLKKAARNFAAEHARNAAQVPSAEVKNAERDREQAARREVDAAVLDVICCGGKTGTRTLDIVFALRKQGIRGKDLYNALRRLRRAGRVRTEGGRKGARNFMNNVNKEGNTE